MDNAHILHRFGIKNLLRTGKLLAVLLVGVSIIGCRGPKGDQGPQGLTGSTGATGLPGTGTRKVYLATPSSSVASYSVPEVKLSDLPSISIYGVVSGFPTLWEQLANLTGVANPASDPGYVLAEGSITIYNCIGRDVKIVIVI